MGGILEWGGIFKKVWNALEKKASKKRKNLQKLTGF